MNILLTGGCGYIGSHTAVSLIEARHSVILADDFRNCGHDVPQRIAAITGVEPKTVEVDVCDKEAARCLFTEQPIDGVIHFAALKSVPTSVKEPLAYYHNNLVSTLTMLELMVEYGVKNIVFSSSATVYGAAHPMPLVETAAIGDSATPYGRTKIMNEHILEDAARAFGLSAVLLRYFNPVGAHPSALLGEDSQGTPGNLMPLLTQAAAGKRERLTVFGTDYPTPDGSGVRDYLHICDLAEGHVKAIEYAADHAGCTAINLGRGEGYSVLQLIETFRRVNGVEVPYDIGPRRPGDVAECWSDPSLAETLLGWKATRTLEDMCRDAWRWQQACE